MKKYDATILLVDDDPQFQTLVEHAFRQNGVKSPIQKVQNAEEAIEYMKGEREFKDRTIYEYPSFVITDLKMPKADGFVVLEYLKKHPQWMVIPTIVFSSSADPDDIKKAYLMGASSYHVKPMTMEKLREQLKILHDYWMTCESPEVDRDGHLLPTNSEGKLGERFK